MQFIDHTGHIFSLASFDVYPTGYEYETFPYIFYLEDEYAKRLSVGNYYIKPIRFLMEKGRYDEVSIKIDSSVFRLIGSKIVDEKVKESGFNIELDEDSIYIKSELSKADLTIIEDDEYAMGVFYVIGNAPSEATWTSNILIDVECGGVHEYCPITVGGVFYDEIEELIINGKNMGVYLPKDIVKAVYGMSVYNDEVNEAMYSQKVKEYMMNYMRLHGEAGNLAQVKSALKFFGWGSKMSIVQLVKTDNEFITQYIRDFLNTDNDLLTRFDNFSHTGLVSIFCELNGETGTEEHPDYNKDFWGEMKPVLEDYTQKLVQVRYDEQDIIYHKPYFDCALAELMIKISCLRNFYQKYFLPMHVAVMSASAAVRVHANDIKYVTKPFIKISETPIAAEQDRDTLHVKFPDSHILYAYTQEHYVDSNYNEFSIYIPEDRYHDIDIDTDVYYINDVCVELPIEFCSDTIDMLDCHLVLERLGGTVMFESDFCFANSKTPYKSLIIYPQLINDRLAMNYWINKKYCLHLLVNGVWHDYEFEMRVPEMHLQFGKLRYKYDYEKFRQVSSMSGGIVDFNACMHMPSLVDVDNINFPKNVVDFGNDDMMEKFVSMYSESPSLPHPNEAGQIAKKYYNRVHYFKLLDDEGNELPYNGHDDVLTDYEVLLYKKLFNDDGTQKVQISNGALNYDAYLMHDSSDINDYKGILSDEELAGLWAPKWYLVLISKETVDCAREKKELDAPTFRIPGLSAEFMASDSKWLINRMEFVDCKGVNHFAPTDIVVGTVNNIELPFMLTHGSKWEITPFSLGMQNDSKVESSTNTFIMSLGGDNTVLGKGYYNITVRYSLDGNVQHQRTHTARILVK